MTSTRLVPLVLLGLAALPLTGAQRSIFDPRFVSGEAVFPVSGDLPGVVLQPQAGARGLAFPTSLVHAGDSRLFLTRRGRRPRLPGAAGRHGAGQDAADRRGSERGPAEFALTGRTGSAIETVFELGEPGSDRVPLIGKW